MNITPFTNNNQRLYIPNFIEEITISSLHFVPLNQYLSGVCFDCLSYWK